MDPNLQAGQAALRARDYAAAVAALDKAISAKGVQADEALYLKALAQYHGKQFDAAIASCTALAETYPKSGWNHKARFLKANAHVQKRDYKSAEAIYETEANRPLSAARKQDVASVIIHFADELATQPDQDDLKAALPISPRPTNCTTARSRWRSTTCAMQVVQEGARFNGRTTRHAMNDFRAYLAEFDPDWMGAGQCAREWIVKKENPAPAGKHPLVARFHLAEAQLKASQFPQARTNLEDLLKLIEAQKVDDAQATLVADARWAIVNSFRMPNPGANELERGVKAPDFLKAHTDDPRSVYARGGSPMPTANTAGPTRRWRPTMILSSAKTTSCPRVTRSPRPSPSTAAPPQACRISGRKPPSTRSPTFVTAKRNTPRPPRLGRSISTNIPTARTGPTASEASLTRNIRWRWTRWRPRITPRPASYSTPF